MKKYKKRAPVKSVGNPKPVEGVRRCMFCFSNLSMYNPKDACYSCQGKKFTEDRLSLV